MYNSPIHGEELCTNPRSTEYSRAGLLYLARAGLESYLGPHPKHESIRIYLSGNTKQVQVVRCTK